MACGRCMRSVGYPLARGVAPEHDVGGPGIRARELIGGPGWRLRRRLACARRMRSVVISWPAAWPWNTTSPN